MDIILKGFSAPSENLFCQEKWWTIKLFYKSNEQNWIKWVHVSKGLSHCETCLMLDGCWFNKDNMPKHPQHPNCHCKLEALDYSTVKENAVAHSDYSKFDPYLFDPDGSYKHGKQKLFEGWGYTIEDSMWLKEEFERQAREKYLKGDYILGKLDRYCQRINITIVLPRKKALVLLHLFQVGVFYLMVT